MHIRIIVLVAIAFWIFPVRADRTTAAVHARTIYLVRHGAYIPDSKVDPEAGPGLSPLGIAQARLIGARLRGIPVHFDTITSSTMARAEQTAAIIEEQIPDVPLSQSALLSECTPPVLQKSDRESEADQKACADRLDSDFRQRFRPTMKADANDIIVAHGNVIRYLLLKALHLDTRSWVNIAIGHASLTVIRVWSDGNIAVVQVGDIGHIPPNLQSWGTPEDPQLIAPADR